MRNLGESLGDGILDLKAPLAQFNFVQMLHGFHVRLGQMDLIIDVIVLLQQLCKSRVAHLEFVNGICLARKFLGKGMRRIGHVVDQLSSLGWSEDLRLKGGLSRNLIYVSYLCSVSQFASQVHGGVLLTGWRGNATPIVAPPAKAPNKYYTIPNSTALIQYCAKCSRATHSATQRPAATDGPLTPGLTGKLATTAPCLLFFW